MYSYYILEKYVGIGGSALRLIRSYFSDRTQGVQIDGGFPKCAAITGVGVDMSPQCFIKGPNGSASYTVSGSKV